MVSINTNLSSLIVQGNLANSTNGLNKAVERLSTGYKINHAGDNAANYSIANKYEAKLSSYDVAADNITMGMDLLSVAQDTISTMQNHGARLQALITQARNGTYGAQSLNALTQEAGAIISEIQRMYTNTEYNGISLFDNLPLPEWAKNVKATAGLTTDLTPKHDGFIDNAKTYTDEEVSAMKKVADYDSFTSGQKYSISSKEELQKLATKVNAGQNMRNIEFVLSDDIDLSSIENWSVMGSSSNPFSGIFNGNGHVIKNLKIDNKTGSQQGLIGYANSYASIKNVGLVNVDIVARNSTGAIVGSGQAKILNCYSTGKIETTEGLVGGITSYNSHSRIENCYSKAEITGSGENVGGLVGRVNDSTISNSFTTGNIINSGDYTGGLIGKVEESTSSVNNCYATGDVKGNNHAGGLMGYTVAATTNCYSTGDVKSKGENVGGLVGFTKGAVSKSYATGNVTGSTYVGGLLGYTQNSVSECYATGDVKGSQNVGGLIGSLSGNVSKVYAKGNVKGTNYVGGLFGIIGKTTGVLNLNNLTASGNVTGTNHAGNFAGGIFNTTDGSAFSTITIANAKVYNSANDMIGFEGKSNGTAYESGQMATWLENIKEVAKPETNLQVGIMGNEASRISFDTGFEYDLSAILSDISSDKAYSTITKFMSTLSEKATDLGAASNRLESALDSVLVNMENLTSSLSTVKDVDMAQESSQYIRMQILQQASATLLATANQSPSIALQLI